VAGLSSRAPTWPTRAETILFAAGRWPEAERELKAALGVGKAAEPGPSPRDQAAARLGGNRACLSVARRLLKRSYHTLRELGEEALQPA
jgi:hypothetical protein